MALSESIEMNEPIGSRPKIKIFNKGIFNKEINIPVKYLILAIIGICILFIAVIIATHFGTKTAIRNGLKKDISDEVNLTFSSSNLTVLNTTLSSTTTDTTTTSSTTTVEITTTRVQSPANSRLPRNLLPNLYELEIQPYIGPEEVYGNKSFTFSGRTKIHMTCVSPTKKIVFHGLGLDINGSNLRLTLSGNESDIGFDSNLVYDEQNQWFTVNLNGSLEAGSEYVLEIPYTGVINKFLSGFYRGSYVENGTTY